ncbi:MAG: hypothetical protein HUJ77_14340, partial [Clostridium sp.]|nr:hypothetical protein [Clostridium sp.]
IKEKFENVKYVSPTIQDYAIIKTDNKSKDIMITCGNEDIFGLKLGGKDE